MKKGIVIFVCVFFLIYSCDVFNYGQLGGADQTSVYYPGEGDFDPIMTFLSGVWYSRNAGIGRLDGYRIGKWSDFDSIAGSKKDLFDLANPPDVYSGPPPADTDYFVLYDDTVYGQSDTGVGGNGGWNYGYVGIVRAVNAFYGNSGNGAVIVEYLRGGAPQWDADIKDGQRPFFGIYYKVLDDDTVQMANAVDLAALYAGEKYYTEKATLEEAVAYNTVENEAELISWGVVVPQNRERGGSPD
jgi:hypothetical protein